MITIKNNEKWPYIPDHPSRILIIGGSWSGKTNILLNLRNEQKDIDKIYLYAKDLSEPKYEYLDDVYENIDNNNPNKNRTILIVFDVVIADIKTNEKFQWIIKDLILKSKYFNSIYQSILFLCFKRCKIKFYTLFDYEN